MKKTLDVSFFGEAISPDDIRSHRAKSVVNYLLPGDRPYFKLLECRARDDLDTLIIQVDVEIFYDSTSRHKSKRIYCYYI
jgi:hypothetical protein